jgi:WD40 repeat protein
MLDWAPDGTWLASGSYDKTVRLWDAVTLDEIARLDHEVALYTLAASPDGRTLVSAGGARIFVWDVATRTVARELKGHEKSVQTLAFSPDSKRVVSAAHDGKAIVFDVASGSAVSEIVPGIAQLMSAAFTPDGAAVVVGDGSGGLGLYASQDGKLVRKLSSGVHSNNHVTVSPNGKRVAVASDVVALVDLVTGQSLASFRVHADGPWDLDFDARGEMLVSCSTDRSIAVTDTRPLAIRSTQREAYAKARHAADAQVEAWSTAGRNPGEMVQAIRADAKLTKEARTALFDAVTSRVGKTKP